MIVLTIFFGVISLISTGFTIWYNRNLVMVEDLTNRITENIKSVAEDIFLENRGNKNGQAAQDIIRFCESLIAERRSSRKIGEFLVEYYAFLIPPMATNCGKIVKDKGGYHGRVVRGEFGGEGKRTVLFGPKHPLPITGKYQAEFRLKCEKIKKSNIDSNNSVVELAVYHGYGKKTLAKEIIKPDEFQDDYMLKTLKFTYFNLNYTPEYVVKLSGPGIVVSVDRITITRIKP